MAETNGNNGKTGVNTIQAEPSWFSGTTYRIPAKAEPSYWGEWAHMGIVVGSLAMLSLSLLAPGVSAMFNPGLDFGTSSIAKAAAGLLNNLAGYAPMFIGMGAGAFINKKVMEKELESGKEIEPPSLFNRGLVEGALHGVGMVALGNLAVKFAMWGMTGFSGGLAGLGSASGLATLLGTTAFPLLIAGVALVGAFRGASRQKDEDERIYRFVEERYAVETGQVLPERGRGIAEYIAPAAGVATAVAAGIPGVDPTGLHGIFSDTALHAVGAHSAQRMYPDFSEYADHPAQRAQMNNFSYVKQEEQRRGRPFEQQQERPQDLGRFASRLSDDRLAQAVNDLQESR